MMVLVAASNCWAWAVVSILPDWAWTWLTKAPRSLHAEVGWLACRSASTAWSRASRLDLSPPSMLRLLTVSSRLLVWAAAPFTLTAKLAVIVLGVSSGSLTVQVTVVGPMGKVAPGDGEQETAGSRLSSSTAVGR